MTLPSERRHLRHFSDCFQLFFHVYFCQIDGRGYNNEVVILQFALWHASGGY